jgi:deoxycytidylate deaminase
MLSTYIKQMCNTIAGSTLQPCIKQSVYAMLVIGDGLCFFGANWMTNGELTVCPRVTAGSVSGADYHFCKDICNQEFHAEVAAIQACIAFGYYPLGGHLTLVGHTYCCDACLAAMQAAGIEHVTVLDNGLEYFFVNGGIYTNK